MSNSSTSALRGSQWMARVLLWTAVGLRPSLLAQVGGNLGGTVTNSTGAAIADAVVKVTNTSKGTTRSLKTGAEGNFRVMNLQPATYEVTVQAVGFGVSKKPATLLVGSDVSVDFALGVAGVAENVTVTGEAAALVETTMFRDNHAYNPTNTPHNLSLTWTTATLPGKIQLSGAFHPVSWPPYLVSAGFDLDGDGNITNDRPIGLPQTVGYGNVSGQLALINAFRANPCAYVYFSNVPCTAKPQKPISQNLLNPHPAVSLDMRLTKVIKFTERRRLEVFFEGYNVTNFVTQIVGSGTSSARAGSLTSSSFLIPTSSLAVRQQQWDTRFSF
jgi:hypothetical protein